MINLDLYQQEYSPRPAQAPYGISAGGVVYRKKNDSYEFLVLGRNGDSGISYHLPKGTLNIGETIESAAAREITEEAGVNVILKTFIGGKHSVFNYKNNLNDKIFLYYVAEYVDEAEMMDDEHDFKEWCSYDIAIKHLKTNLKREDEFVERAYKYLKSQP